MTPPRRLTLLAAPLLAAATVAGCGIANPYQHHAAHAATTESSPTAVKPAEVPRGASSPQAALARYASTDINWTSRTVGGHQRQLAANSVGAARAAALQAAASYGAGSQIQLSKLTNTGQVTSIAPGQGPLAGQWVITTQETTGGTGDYQDLPAQPHIYDARLEHTLAGWIVSEWSPQS